jgi:hypothetical protein
MSTGWAGVCSIASGIPQIRRYQQFEEVTAQKSCREKQNFEVFHLAPIKIKLGDHFLA